MKTHTQRIVIKICIWTCSCVFVVLIAFFLWLDPAGMFTIVPPKFSWSKMHALTTTMTKDDVLLILGPPLEKMDKNLGYAEVWVYSEKNRINVFYRRHMVFFNNTGQVVRTRSAIAFE